MEEEIFFIDTVGDDKSTSDVKTKPENQENHGHPTKKLIYTYNTESEIPLGSEAPNSESQEDAAPKIKRPSFPRHMNKRYHETGDWNAKFKPGMISPALTNALGLHRNQLPLHIYRMRCLGYPPGWLKKVEVAKGELSIIDHDGDLNENNKEVSYNFDQLISYPGFNAPLGPQCPDQWCELGGIPMQESHMLDNFKRILKQNGYNPSQPNYNSAQFHVTPLNENGQEVLGEESLDDLEKERERLLQELEEANGSDAGDSATVDLPTVENQKSLAEQVTDTDLPQDDSAAYAISPPEELGFGSPVLHSVTTPLPSLEKWSLGVSDFRAFENLPNCEGRYDRMNEAIKKCRESVGRKSVSLNDLEDLSSSSAHAMMPSTGDHRGGDHSSSHHHQHRESFDSSVQLTSSSHQQRDFHFATPDSRHYGRGGGAGHKHPSHFRNSQNRNTSTPYSRSQSYQGQRRY